MLVTTKTEVTVRCVPEIELRGQRGMPQTVTRMNLVMELEMSPMEITLPVVRIFKTFFLGRHQGFLWATNNSSGHLHWVFKRLHFNFLNVQFVETGISTVVQLVFPV